MNLMTTGAFGALFVGAMISFVAPSNANDIGAASNRPAIASECEAEAVAFIEVADLAHAFGRAGDVFEGALFELREQLLDCLVIAEEGGNERLPSFRGNLGLLPEPDEQRRV